MKITLTTAQAVALAKSIAPAVSDNPAHPHLHTVQVVTTGEHVTFTATDGYRLHRITVPQTDIDPCEPLQLGGVELVGALLGIAKAIGKGSGAIELAYDYGTKVVATGAGESMNVPALDIGFPSCTSILAPYPETESGAYYDTVFLADIVTAAGHISGKTKKGSANDAQRVKIMNIHPRKPMHVTTENYVTGMTFYGVLMPRRAK